MVQFVKTTQKYGQTANTVFEVPMIANKNGEIVTASNPFPVTLGFTGTGSTSLRPLGLEVSMGLVPGYSFNHKFGAVDGIGNNTTGTVWDIPNQLYPWTALDTPAIVNVERNDTNDNGITVTVQGLDGDYNPVSEDITITGADQVGTQLFKRVNRAFISGATTNAGDIDIEAGAAGGTTVARIQAGLGQTLMSVFTVPAGKTAYFHRITATAQDGKDATGWMYVREVNGVTAFRIKHTWEFYGDGGQYHYDFAFPLPVSEKSDIDMRVTTRDKNGRYTIAFDILLVDN